MSKISFLYRILVLIALSNTYFSGFLIPNRNLLRHNVSFDIIILFYYLLSLTVRLYLWGMSMEYIIREIKDTEYPLLDDFLYEAIFVPNGAQPPERCVINLPELQVYVSDFGKKKDDVCFVAEVKDKVVGAVWARVMNDYGHIEDGVASLAISLYKEYRGYGIGTTLMKRILCELKQIGYKKTSLSVQKANFAVWMYLNMGFEIIDESEEEYIMICNL